MRSNYWKYFGFPADSQSNILTKKKIICNICKTVLAYNKNTTNLKSHINAKHKEYEMFTKKIKLTEDPKIGQTTKNWKTDSTEEEVKSNKYMKLMNETIKDDEYEVETLETNSMDEILHGNENEQVDDSETYMETEEILEPEFEYVRIAEEPPEIVSPEIRSYDMKSVIVSWLTTDLHSTSIVDGLGLQKMIRIIGDCEVPSREDILEELNTIYSNQHSENYSKIQNFISDQHFSLSFEKWENFEKKTFITVYINYLDFKNNDFEFINNVVDVLYLDPKFAERIDWNEYFNNHSFINFDKCAAVVLDFDDEELKQFLRTKETPIIPCLIDIFRKSIELCFQLNAVKNLIKNSDSNKFWLEKWKILENSNDDTIKELINCLNPMKTALEGLAMEQTNPALSNALITQLCEFYYTIDPDTDSNLIQEIKNAIKESLDSSITRDKHSGIFLLLDPRFKDFAKDDDVVEIKKIIRAITVPGPQIIEKKVVIKSEGNNRKSGLSFLFANNVVKCKVEKRDVLDDELKNYREQESSTLETCPVTWWMENGYLYPNLKKIADIFNCVPACVNTQSKLNFTERIDFHEKRFYCKEESSVLGKIVYLHFNFK